MRRLVRSGVPEPGPASESCEAQWRRRWISVAVLALFLTTLLPTGAIAANDSRERVVTTTIQAAVDAAQPGDTIRVPPGTYRENVVVSKDNLHLTGSLAAVLDGTGLSGTTGIRVAPAAPATEIDGFRLSGLTIQNYSRTGVVLNSVKGFRIGDGRYRQNHEYAIFPIRSSDGTIERNLVTGSDDAAIYVGQSQDVSIQGNQVGDSTIGIEVENSARIAVRQNRASGNSIGVFVQVSPLRTVKATEEVVVERNVLEANNRPNPVTDPTELLSHVPSGMGLLIIAADRVTAEQNVVSRNDSAGIALGRMPAELAALDPAVNPLPDRAVIKDNVLAQNGRRPDPKLAPLPGADLLWDTSGADNCWADNHVRTSFPQTLPPCR